MSLLRRPAWWAVLLTLAGTLLFLRLGVWQLDRANEKEQILRRYAAAETAPLRDFAAVATAPADDGFPRVRLRGTYLADRLYLLDNPRHDQRGGVEVYAPFRPEGMTQWVLVDLGFLPGNGTDKAPQIPALPEGPQDVHGLYQPAPGVGFEMGGDALSRQTAWPKTTIYLDIPQVARDLGQPLYPRVVSLDADPAAIYVREHQPDFSSMPPARHRAYAFQWFTFAVAAVVIFLILHRKRKKPKSDSP
ncbi:MULTISPECIES: SURF1 family protein [Dyella]|uniref:SURF1-like protein n=2 Tax=Dyella TaxID=231454 RepID=A0A4R0YIH5_9GAMM|nr:MULTISPECIES: SURF1 family protein [Dyella]TBR36669.1 SURF1 family protein [Dyella terrae]TCI08240.1 SURF1 family protein [Dyella soli]